MSEKMEETETLTWEAKMIANGTILNFAAAIGIAGILGVGVLGVCAIWPDRNLSSFKPEFIGEAPTSKLRP